MIIGNINSLNLELGKIYKNRSKRYCYFATAKMIRNKIVKINTSKKRIEIKPTNCTMRQIKNDGTPRPITNKAYVAHDKILNWNMRYNSRIYTLRNLEITNSLSFKDYLHEINQPLDLEGK